LYNDLHVMLRRVGMKIIIIPLKRLTPYYVKEGLCYFSS
jgi:hypothetical protein